VRDGDTNDINRTQRQTYRYVQNDWTKFNKTAIESKTLMQDGKLWHVETPK